MKYIFSSLFLTMLGVTVVSAYEYTVTEVSRPYEVVAVDSDPGYKQVYLGELKDYPIMYEVVAEESFDLSSTIRQRYNSSVPPYVFSLIMIRQDDRGGGVTEVARLRTTAEDWKVVKDSVLGMTFWESETLSRKVESGVYRIEISTPENLGRYMLTIGEQGEEPGYFATLGNIRTTQKFFGYSVFKLLAAKYVYYTLGVILLLVVIQRTWKYRKSIAHVA